MQLAIISESPADEAALHAFCQTLIGREIALVEHRLEVRRGWPALKKQLPVILRSVRYQTTATAVLLVVDSDGSDLRPGSPTNRMHELQEIVRRDLSPHSAGDRRITCLLGLAVPCIEAWWLAHKNPQISETTWHGRETYPRMPYDKNSLKRDLYGSEYSPRRREIMISAAREAAGHSDLLHKRFPAGLSPLLAGFAALAEAD